MWIHGNLRVNPRMIGHNILIRNVQHTPPCPSCGEISKWIPSSVRLSRFHASQILLRGCAMPVSCREGGYITSSICCSDSFLPTLSNSHPFYSILLLYTLPVSLSFLFPYTQIISLGLQYSPLLLLQGLALSGFIQRRFWTLTSSTIHIYRRNQVLTFFSSNIFKHFIILHNGIYPLSFPSIATALPLGLS